MDRYLAYMFCVILVDDKTMPTAAKFKAIDEFRRPPPIAVAPQPQPRLQPHPSQSREAPVKCCDRQEGDTNIAGPINRSRWVPLAPVRFLGTCDECSPFVSRTVAPPAASI
jgi:hypothetical protein